MNLILKNIYSMKRNFDARRLFGILMSINYILYFFIFDYGTSNQNLSLTLRLIASTLCIPLIFEKFSEKNSDLFRNIYWYFTVCYCLPFFFSFKTLLHELSSVWLMNSVSAAFLMILVVDIWVFYILLFIGVSLALGCYRYGFGLEIIQTSDPITIFDIVATYFAIIIIGSVFAYKRQEFDRKKNIYIESINKLNHKLDSLVHKRTEELRDALIQKTKALLLKDEFIRNLSHEVRTPLTGI
ncbi:MAG: hypothetical protein SFT93_00340, partial [Rickettsiaceae bacterium]|nr:hypothetical protein [Rickettsiaceae bacterium]